MTSAEATGLFKTKQPESPLEGGWGFPIRCLAFPALKRLSLPKLSALAAPPGAIGSSPAIHCWGRSCRIVPSPVGTAEIEDSHPLLLTPVVPTGLARASAQPSDKSLGYYRSVPTGLTENREEGHIAKVWVMTSAEATGLFKTKQPESPLEGGWGFPIRCLPFPALKRLSLPKLRAEHQRKVVCISRCNSRG
jgi:hypothetical protein